MATSKKQDLEIHFLSLELAPALKPPRHSNHLLTLRLVCPRPTIAYKAAERTVTLADGVFAPDEVQRVQERQRIAPGEPETAPEPLQRPSGGMPEPEPVPHRAETPPAADVAEAAVGKYVICPHCGERIVLSPSMIGGE